jgi:hypothetical protein
MDGTYRGVMQDGKVVFPDQRPPVTDGTEVFVVCRDPDIAFMDELARWLAQAKQPLPAELLELARTEFTAEEILSRVRKLQAEGGRELHEFLDDLKKAAGEHG